MKHRSFKMKSRKFQCFSATSSNDSLKTTINSYNLGCHIENIAKAQWKITPFKVEYDFNGATKDGSPKKNNVYFSFVIIAYS